MIPAPLALPLTAAFVAAADFANRRLVGFLPDDPPRPGRKQHERPMPLAGIIVPLAVLPWLIADGAFCALAAVALAAAVGFVDDRGKEHGRDLGWRTKTGVLLAVAVAGACAAGHAPTALTADAVTNLAIAAAVVFVLTNATNFLDNTDGVAAAVSGASLLLLAGERGWLLAGGFVALGFLPFNWPRPRVFLGDGGAYVLGALVGIAAAERVPATVGAAAVQLADFVQVVTARVVLGRPPWVGDRRHLTHIAQNLGCPRWLVAPLFAALTVATALALR
jgi:UDP-N-acetylmuramyl pentapeptide phosphotransferase/UDP-N-acetylglucosamine-1-phosphate transferase